MIFKSCCSYITIQTPTELATRSKSFKAFDSFRNLMLSWYEMTLFEMTPVSNIFVKFLNP